MYLLTVKFEYILKNYAFKVLTRKCFLLKTFNDCDDQRNSGRNRVHKKINSV